MRNNFVDPFKVNKGEYLNPVTLKAEKAIKQVLANRTDIVYIPSLAKPLVEALQQEGLLKSEDKSICEVLRGEIPLPYTLSQWERGKEVFYKCPKCGCDLRLLGNRQNYCFDCGQKLDWESTIKEVSQEFKNTYEKLYEDYYRGKIDYKDLELKKTQMMLDLYKTIKEEKNKQK